MAILDEESVVLDLVCKCKEEADGRRSSESSDDIVIGDGVAGELALAP